MLFRLEKLPLNAFHQHRRARESADAQRQRELCPGCQRQPETPTHFLLECPAYAALRSPTFNAAVADAQNSQDADTEVWRTLLKLDNDSVPGYIFNAWRLRRAALTGREANGGNSMALSHVPGVNTG